VIQGITHDGRIPDPFFVCKNLAILNGFCDTLVKKDK
jgi:hypothetical protein